MKNEEYKKYIEKHAADPNQAGFDFQFFAFLYLLLDIDKGEVIKYESDDDILIVRTDGTYVLIQVKHGIYTKSGNVPKLSEHDIDFWKTLDNWVNLISMSKDDNYILDRKFEILTNKGVDSKNELIQLIRQYENKKIDILVILQKFDCIKNGTTNNIIIDCINKIINLDFVKQKQFFERISINQQVDIIQDIKDRLKYKKNVPENKINTVFSNLINEFKISHFHSTIKREKTILEADQIYKKIRNIINPIFDRKLGFDRSIDIDLPTNIVEQTFIKQLLDIERVYIDEADELKGFYLKKIESENILCEEQLQCNISETQLNNIENEAIDFWSVKHDISSLKIKRKLRREESVDEDEYNEAANNCFNEILVKEFELLDLPLSNGYFFSLSDKPKIGWRYDWEEKYKGKR